MEDIGETGRKKKPQENFESSFCMDFFYANVFVHPVTDKSRWVNVRYLPFLHQKSKTDVIN